MDKVICKTYLLDLQMENVIYTCIYNIFIYADGYDHLQNLLVWLCRWIKSCLLWLMLSLCLYLSICWANHICRWIWSSVKLIGCSIQMDEIICTCIYIEFISVQMDTFICTYTSLVLNYMLMDMVICTSKMLVYADGWSLMHLYIGFPNLFADG